MRKYILFLLLLVPLSVISQPTESEVTALVKAEFSDWNETIISIDFNQPKHIELSGTRLENEGQGWENNHYKHVQVITKHSAGPNAKKVWHLAAKYKVSGGKYTFERINWGNTKLIDLEFPEVEDAIAMTLDSYKNMKTIFKGLSSRVLASPIDLYIAEDPKFSWYHEDSFSFEVWIDYYQVASNTEVDKMKSLKKLRFYRNDDTKAFDDFTTLNTSSAPKSLERKKYTSEQVSYMSENSTVFIMADKEANPEKYAEKARINLANIEEKEASKSKSIQPASNNSSGPKKKTNSLLKAGKKFIKN